MKRLIFVELFCFFLFLASCRQNSNLGVVQLYSYSEIESEWIREGEPIEFEGEFWYPADGTESLLDSEVYLLGEYRQVEFFVEKIDIKPFDRLYTKFGKNKFRYFYKRKE